MAATFSCPRYDGVPPQRGRLAKRGLQMNCFFELHDGPGAESETLASIAQARDRSAWPSIGKACVAEACCLLAVRARLVKLWLACPLARALNKSVIVLTLMRISFGDALRNHAPQHLGRRAKGGQGPSEVNHPRAFCGQTSVPTATWICVRPSFKSSRASGTACTTCGQRWP